MVLMGIDANLSFEKLIIIWFELDRSFIQLKPEKLLQCPTVKPYTVL